MEEEKRYVAKVYRVNPEKMQIDLSLKRVSEKEKKERLEEEKKERRAKKILEVACTKAGQDYAKLCDKIRKSYSSFNQFIEDYEQGKTKIDIPKALQKHINSLIASTDAKKEIQLSQVIELLGVGNRGILNLKNALIEIKNKYPELEIKYLGAPKYMLTLKTQKPKEDTKRLENIINSLGSASGVFLMKVYERKD